jgi:hypothetical protein
MISIVICSINPERYAAICANLRQLLGNEPHEFIGIHDAKSAAEGYNRGVRLSRGEIVIACHDDIEILAPDFKQRLLPRLAQYDLLGAAGSNRLAGPQWHSAGPNYVFGQVAWVRPEENCFQVMVWNAAQRCFPNMKVMDGLFLAGRREVFSAIPYDQETFRNFHLYDLDITCRAAQAGFRLAVCTDLAITHLSGGNFDDRWKGDCELFIRKFGAAFGPIRTNWWVPTQFKIQRKEDLLEMMRNPDWPD